MAGKVGTKDGSQRGRPPRPLAEGNARAKELGKRLEALRTKADFSQEILGAQFGYSQRLVGLWESGKRRIPAKVIKWIDRMEQGGEIQRISFGGIDPGLYSAARVWLDREAAGDFNPIPFPDKQPGRFSFPKKVFGMLWDHSAIRARGVKVRGFLAPSDTDGYANALVIVRFDKLETLDGEHLRLDHLCASPMGPHGPARLDLTWPIGPNDAAFEELLGMPMKRAWTRILELSRSPEWKERPIQNTSAEEENFRSALGQPGSTRWEALQKFVKRKKIQATQAEIAEDEDVKSTIGPHAVSYEIWNANTIGDDNITIFLKSEYGINMKDIDAIGFPLYADLLAEKISIQVEFLGLRPDPNPPATEPYLIRRNSNRAVPGTLGFVPELKPHCEERGEDVVYTIHLVHPRPGWGYLLSWRRIIPFAGPDGTAAPGSAK